MVPVSFVAPVSAVFVALVREDVLDHAIWTVVVVSHPMVTDHHHQALVIEIVVVTAHAIHFQFLLFLSHQLVEEMGAILVVQANLAGPGGSGGAGGVSGGSIGTSRSSKKVNLGGDGELVSSPLSFSGVVSRC